MKLRVQNLGPVREAELDLGKPLIVLTGPNNSGKTYLAWAAYSLARMSITGALESPPPACLRTWVDRMLKTKSGRFAMPFPPETADDVLRTIIDKTLHRLPDDFAAPPERFEDTRLELTPSAAEQEVVQAATLGWRYEGHGNRSFEFAADEQGLYVAVHQLGSTGQSQGSPAGETYETESDIRVIAQIISMRVATILLNFAHCVLPVERLAINLFARELAAQRTALVDDLLTDAAKATAPMKLRDKLQQRAARYPLVIRDALQSAIRITAGTPPGPFASLADELETDVLGGRIELDTDNNLRFVPRQDARDGIRLGLHESASVVKSLVSLVLYLRHDAQPGERLVIDEPELNLHPDNQRRVTRILAKAVNRGLKIMMSTHSDYVIRELNNLVMLGQNSDEARALAQELGYQPEQTLRPDQIGAYLVNEGVCTSLEVNETGFDAETIEAEIHKLNQDAQTIYFRLFED